MSILNELYHEWYEMKSGNRPEIGEAQRRFDEVWGRVEKELGAECAEELWDRIFAYMNEECSNEFQAGFRLGAQLMQELHLSAALIGTSTPPAASPANRAQPQE